MTFLVGSFRFWYEFIVGDDWLVVAGVVAGLALTWVLAHHDVTAWWLMPVVVILLLVSSLWRAVSRAGA